MWRSPQSSSPSTGYPPYRKGSQLDDRQWADPPRGRRQRCCANLRAKVPLRPLRRSRRSQVRVTPALVGNSSQVRPSSSRPARPFPTRCIRTTPSGLSDSITAQFPPSRSMRLTAPRWLSSALVHKADSGACAPHCLKKYRTPAAWHWSRRDRAQSGCVGRAPGPDSPPAITHPLQPSRQPLAEVDLAQERLAAGEPHTCHGCRRELPQPNWRPPTSTSRPKPRATGSAIAAIAFGDGP